MNIEIAVIDTMIDLDNTVFENRNIEICNNRCSTKEGHGTAVCSIILQNTKNTNITLYTINDDNEVEYLIEILKDIAYSSKFYRILNISLGVFTTEKSKELEFYCNLISEKGTLIISAFDNFGSMSYPASFKNVIGIASSPELKNINEYIYLENSDINILGYYGQFRVSWLNNQYKFVYGNSLVAPYVSAKIATLIENNNSITNNEILKTLKDSSTRIIKFPKVNENNSISSSIRNGIVFPLNKEIETLIRNSSSLKFEISHVCDIKYKFRIGKSTKEMYNTEKNWIVEDIKSIDWNDKFDTIILGHLEEIISIVGNNILNYIIENAKKYNKKIYSFQWYDEFNQLGESLNDIVEIPIISDNQTPKRNLGKLWGISKPVLGVFGTSPKQGKFTLQLKLRKELLKRNYKVGQLGSEPASLLFGFNEVYHFGLNGNNLHNEAMVSILNQQLKNIDSEDVDLIVVGSQSGTVPTDFRCLEKITIPQLVFLYGTNPDCIILCVNIHDDIDYIERTVKFIESSIDSKVIALVISPITYDFDDIIHKRKFVDINNINVIEKMKEIERVLNINTYFMDDNIGNTLVNSIEKAFS
ncbi:MAG: S8 family serine peptidase [Clostridium perfringens]|nr:S8 family serine peptidase [Clostridium perfringens]